MTKFIKPSDIIFFFTLEGMDFYPAFLPELFVRVNAVALPWRRRSKVPNFKSCYFTLFTMQMRYTICLN